MKRVVIKAEVEDLDLWKLTEALSRAFPNRTVKIETSVEDVLDWKVVEEDGRFFLVDPENEDDMLGSLVTEEDGDDVYDCSPGNGYETREKAEKVRRRLRNGEVRGLLG